jgi:hypothetical protein
MYVIRIYMDREGPQKLSEMFLDSQGTCSVTLRNANTFVILLVAVRPPCGLVIRVPGYRCRGSGFDSRRYEIFWEVVGLERSPLSLVRIIEELLEWKSSGPVQENRFNGCGNPLRWPRDTLYPQKLALSSPTSGGRLVGVVRLRTNGHGVGCCWNLSWDPSLISLVTSPGF